MSRLQVAAFYAFTPLNEQQRASLLSDLPDMAITNSVLGSILVAHEGVNGTINSYETAIGSFEGSLDPGTDSFRDFPAWAEASLRPLVNDKPPKRIAMFCTGGIRCEKASSYLQSNGFGEVLHLRGGILNYLGEIPEQESRWQGECFVFDQRVALNHQLEPGVHSLCHACGLPLSPSDRADPSYIKGVQCIHCIDRFSESDRARFLMRQQQFDQTPT